MHKAPAHAGSSVEPETEKKRQVFLSEGYIIHKDAPRCQEGREEGKGKQSRHVRSEEAIPRSLETVCKAYRRSLTVFKDSPNKDTLLAKTIKRDTLSKYVTRLLTPTQLHIETFCRNVFCNVL